MQVKQEFPAHSLMRIEIKYKLDIFSLILKIFCQHKSFFQLKNVMKSLKHKDIHTNFKHIYLITFLHKACAKK
jgi:hypothetical protein